MMPPTGSARPPGSIDPDALRLVVGLVVACLFIGFAVLSYQLLRGFIQQRERKRLIEWRREEDLCVRCGEPIDHTRATCINCGQEPDTAQIKRIASVVKNRDDYTRSRSVLTPQRQTATVSQKEQALLQRRRQRRQG